MEGVKAWKACLRSRKRFSGIHITNHSNHSLALEQFRFHLQYLSDTSCNQVWNITYKHDYKILKTKDETIKQNVRVSDGKGKNMAERRRGKPTELQSREHLRLSTTQVINMLLCGLDEFLILIFISHWNLSQPESYSFLMG